MAQIQAGKWKCSAFQSDKITPDEDLHNLPQHGQRKSVKMCVNIVHYHAIARWSWDTRGRDRRRRKKQQECSTVRQIGGTHATNEEDDDSADGEDDVCGICQNPYEGVAPDARYPGDEWWVSELFRQARNSS